MKITAPNSPRLRAKDNATPVTSAGHSEGKRTLRNTRASDAPRLTAASSSAADSSSSTGCTVRTTKGMLVKAMATMMPRGVGHLDADAGKNLPVPAIVGKQRGEGDACHGGRQRKRKVDHRINQALAGKIVTDQDPGQ